MVTESCSHSCSTQLRLLSSAETRYLEKQVVDSPIYFSTIYFDTDLLLQPPECFPLNILECQESSCNADTPERKDRERAFSEYR